jgi:hypothetical protein
MFTNGPILHAGMIDFGEPIFLILGGPEGFLWLADLIESRWTGIFSGLSSKIRLTNTDLALIYSDSDGGLGGVGSVLRWTLSARAVRSFPEQLRALALSDGPHHAYLDDPEGRGIQVIASKGEYEPTVFG